MSDFSEWKEEMELHDPSIRGGRFTWFRGINHKSAARLHLIDSSTQWNGVKLFKDVRQDSFF